MKKEKSIIIKQIIYFYPIKVKFDKMFDLQDSLKYPDGRAIIPVAISNQDGRECVVMALIDTGSISNLISINCISRLQLNRVSDRIFKFYDSKDTIGEYEFFMKILDNNKQDSVAITNKLQFGSFDNKGDYVDVILGTEFLLNNCEFHYNNPKGEFTLKSIEQ